MIFGYSSVVNDQTSGQVAELADDFMCKVRHQVLETMLKTILACNFSNGRYCGFHNTNIHPSLFTVHIMPQGNRNRTIMLLLLLNIAYFHMSDTYIMGFALYIWNL